MKHGKILKFVCMIKLNNHINMIKSMNLHNLDFVIRLKI